MPDEPLQKGHLTAERITGVVLCGGASRRMGQDKATLEVAGERLLDRAVEALSGHVNEVLLACGAEERYADRGLRLALDAGADLGPLGGLGAGLAQARTEWVLLLACDRMVGPWAIDRSPQKAHPTRSGPAYCTVSARR